MKTGRKVSLKFNVQWLPTMFICTITLFASANYTRGGFFYNSLTGRPPQVRPGATAKSDTVPVIRPDTVGKPTQKVDTIHVNVSKDSLDAPVNYTATDSMVLDVPSKKITLYNEATTKYTDIDLSAYKIQLDQEKHIIVATYSTDTAGKVIGRVKFIQGENTMDSDSITYSIKTQKGITTSTYTTQGEMFVYGERIKKISPNEYYALHGRLTTCNLDTPHFAFVTKKLKLVNKKFAVSGPIHPEFEGVPVPIYIPFGFFPMSQGRHSGLIAPTFTANEQFGLGLEHLGYYKVLNDNFDVTLRTDIYSYGGYRLNLTPTYRKRYRYQGQFNLAYQRTRFLSDAGDKEYETNKSFNIFWSHTVDSKARPGTNFSANVNAGSTKFNRYVANNPSLNYQNQLSSSITYSKNWNNKYNLTVSANHNQNNNTQLINLSLPNISFTATTLYPFQRKEFVGEPKWYEKLGIGLNTNVAGQASFYDSLFNMRQLIDTFQWGAQHSIPITLSLPALGPLQIAPGISYQEKWYAQKFYRVWNGKDVDTTITKGFYTARDISFSLGVNTAIFGTFQGFGKKSRIKAIRHVIRPTFSINYKPDLARKDYYSQQIDSTGRVFRFSPYEGSIFGAFGEGKFGGVGFGFDNNLEMKVRSKTDTAEAGDKKIKLIDGFGFNGGYNLMADSFNLSNFNLYLRSTLFDKINITAGGTIDPYSVDQDGFRVNRYVWQNGKFSPGRLTNGNIAISTSFRSQDKKDKDKEANKQNDNDQRLPMTMEEQQSELDYIRNNPAEFADFNVQWSLSVSYSLNFSKVFKRDYSGFETEINSNLSLNGDFNLTKNWKMGMTTYYDFKTSSIQSLTMFLSRELHCWQMSINVTPVGLYKFFNITINPKSSLLRDIRVNRSRYFYGGT